MNVSKAKVGFDILVQSPDGKQKLYVEVKGRAAKAGFISMTPAEAQFLNLNRENAVVALVLADSQGNVGLHLRRPTEKQLTGAGGEWEGQKNIIMDRFLDSAPLNIPPPSKSETE